MLRVFSKGTLNHLLEHYPNLNEESANRILTESRITTDYSDMPVFGASFLIRDMDYVMHVNPVDANTYFFGQENISLPLGEDGIIYKESQ